MSEEALSNGTALVIGQKEKDRVTHSFEVEYIALTRGAVVMYTDNDVACSIWFFVVVGELRFALQRQQA